MSVKFRVVAFYPNGSCDIYWCENYEINNHNGSIDLVNPRDRPKEKPLHEYIKFCNVPVKISKVKEAPQ